MFVMCSFAQKKNAVLIGESKPNNENITFKIGEENFRFLKNIHKKRNVSFNEISKEIISINTLKSLTDQKMKKDKINDSFSQTYFERYFNLYVFTRCSESKNKGILYEVEWILSITNPEVD